MIKKLLSLALIMFSLYSLQAQTIAPDFTAVDCNGVSHNLYTELNSGKVIVLDWVMPCSACIGPSLTAYNIVQSYTSGNVLYYLIDDVGNTTCSTLSGWATNNSIGSNRMTFSTASIVESSYGGVGMPHVAVVGPNHTIYFNGLNGAAGNPTGIQNAINSALSASGIVDPTHQNSNLTIAISDLKTVKATYTLNVASASTLFLFNEEGKIINTKALGYQSAGNYSVDLDLRKQSKGIYFLKLSTGTDSQTAKFMLPK